MIDNNTILEVKCPYSSKDCTTMKEAIQTKKVRTYTFKNINSKLNVMLYTYIIYVTYKVRISTLRDLYNNFYTFHKMYKNCCTNCEVYIIFCCIK